MMDAVAYHLRAHSPFHFGVRGVGVEATGILAHADTLFAALCLGLRELEGDQRLTEFLEAFPNKDQPDCLPPLLLSSAFPYGQVNEGAAVRFYPGPHSRPADVEVWGQNPEQRKKLKKVAFVSETLFRAWVRGEPLADHFTDENLLHSGEVWLTSNERTILERKTSSGEELRLWKVEGAPRVTLDRASHASQVYQVGQVHFQSGGGLWFAVRWLDERWQPMLKKVLMALGEVGIGGERSAGHGQFTLHETLSPDLPDNTEPLQITLSPYHPTHAEVQAGVLAGNRVSYRLLTRRGWLGSPEGGGYRHRTVRMLAEGSIFRAGDSESEMFGDLVNVTPHGFSAHPVYRYGLAFPIGVKGNG
jgi:CRISPR-associated protein Csm4